MPNATAPQTAWVLVGLVHRGERLSTIRLSPLPFRIGRHPGLHLTMPAASLSREHAEFYLEGNDLYLRDLDSTNGTFVNRERIHDQAVRDGDIIHFAEFEFRLEALDASKSYGTMVMGDLPPPQLFKGTRELAELLRLGAVSMRFQPVVTLPGGDVIGYEGLGRGCYPGIPESPVELFRIAESLGSEVELSRLFRRKALEAVIARGPFPELFLNTHRSEIGQPGLLDSLVQLRRDAPELAITIEIHEAAVVEVARIAELRAGMLEHRIGLAYDDFGAGQARLLELGEAPPDVLKFDVRFVRHLDVAPDSKRRMVKSLVTIACNLGAEPLAEGVETTGEAEACIEVGFTRAQGYYFGHPVPIDLL
jgi:EAL domain-containing protein (putative c-di-GMP-specific phosphodiesterase class I)